MLSRRHIRLKVMQSLYSKLNIKKNDIAAAETSMLTHFKEVVELKLVVISLFLEIVNYADNFYEMNKKKFLPKNNDLTPNTRFVDNKIVFRIRQDKKLNEKVLKVSQLWLDNDHDIPRKLFNIILKSNLYSKYLNSEDISSDLDKKFIIDVMNECVLNNELVHHIFEERSIYWIDDLPFIATIIFGNIRESESLNPSGPFKDKSDKKFALSLFRNTIENSHKYEEIIVRFAKNWELDRIAKMDQLFLKMAFTEILTMPDLPIKVSMNEYIEISKYYSTSKSKLFVNGILDNFVKTFNNEGKIKKTGLGLVE